MFFEHDSIAFEIVNVFFFDQYNIKTHNTNRKFDALGFRMESDAILDTGDTQIELGTGALAFVPSELDYDRTAQRDKMLVVDFKALSPTSDKIEYFYPSDFRKYKVLFERLYKVWTSKELGYRYRASAILNEILAEAYNDMSPFSCSDARIYPSVKYMEENCFKTEFSISKAAEASYVSEVYFRKIFKKEFGISPKKYVINKRMEYAASLIASGYHTLNEVAFLCGYRDYKHFSVEFKKVMGISPSDYK